MKCLNPNCSSKMYTMDGIITCDGCGTTVSPEVYANWPKQNVLEATAGSTETSYKDRLESAAKFMLPILMEHYSATDDCQETSCIESIEFAKMFVRRIDEAVKEQENA